MDNLLRSLEGFSDKESDKWLTFWRRLSGESFEGLLEDPYLRVLLEQIPKMVQRTLRLSQIVTSKIPNSPTVVYFREATRTYIFGFWQASVALSRAAVEEGLREKVKDSDLGIEANDLSLLAKSANRSGILDDSHFQLARRVQMAGNRVLHGKPTSDREAWDVLWAARGVLVHVFGNE